MAAIDPALLQSQWLQYQQSQLSKSAIIPQAPQYATQYAPQYVPSQPQGELVSSDTLNAIAQFMDASSVATNDAAAYISYLQGQLEKVDREYSRLVSFSAQQDELIERFLFDRNFALQYARYGWILNPIDNQFASELADVYLEIASLSPYQQSQQRDPRFTGNPNLTLAAQLVPQAQNSIPPLPGSNGIGNGSITMEQYLIAQQQGHAGAARAAAMANPVNLYASLFQ